MKRGKIAMTLLLVCSMICSAFALTGCEKLAEKVYVTCGATILYHGEQTITVGISPWEKGIKPIRDDSDPGVVRFKKEIPENSVRFAPGVLDGKTIREIERVDDTTLRIKISGKVNLDAEGQSNADGSCNFAIRIYADALENKIDTEYIAKELHYMDKLTEYKVEGWRLSDGKYKMKIHVPKITDRTLTSITKDKITWYYSSSGELKKADARANAVDFTNYEVEYVEKKTEYAELHYVLVTAELSDLQAAMPYGYIYIGVHIDSDDGCVSEENYDLFGQLENASGDYVAD